jgi:hypothetical protein
MPRIAKPRKRAAPIKDWDSFLFRIEEVDPHYSFSDGSKFQPTAHNEHLHLHVVAVCVSPPKFDGRKTRFTLIGDRQLEQDQWMQKSAPENHRGVGTITMRGEQSEYLGSIPYDSVWHISAMMISGGLRFIYLHGAALFRGSARISSISFYREFDLEDA